MPPPWPSPPSPPTALPPCAVSLLRLQLVSVRGAVQQVNPAALTIAAIAGEVNDSAASSIGEVARERGIGDHQSAVGGVNPAALSPTAGPRVRGAPIGTTFERAVRDPGGAPTHVDAAALAVAAARFAGA